MPLPRSFMTDGFVPGNVARKRMKLASGRLLKPLMIGTEGDTNSGKSEFILSCPGPGLVLAMDRGFDGMLDNPNPPASRRDDFAWKVIQAPINTSATQSEFAEYFKEFRDTLYKALANPEAVTIGIDGDSDSWELQRLAEFGKLANVYPMTKYGDSYARRRAIIARAWDSGKIIIGTNKLRPEFVQVIGADGNPVFEADGQPKKEKSGRMERQGFPDQDYLWQIQIRHLVKPPTFNPKLNRVIPGDWGLRILKSKARPELIGTELWGEDCNFRGLVTLLYPNVPLEEWGLA